MRNIFLVLAISILHQQQPAAQVQHMQPTGPQKDYKRLWYLNIQYIQSWVNADTATYNKLLWAEDFVHQSGSNGLLYSKKQLMPIFGEKRFASIEYFYASNTFIQFITDSVAMVLSRPVFLGKGSTEESLSQYNDVYVKRNGNWVCVSANITAITQPGKPLPIVNKIPPATTFITYLQPKKEDLLAITRLQTINRKIFEQADDKSADSFFHPKFILLDNDGSLYSKKKLPAFFKKGKNKPASPYTIENLFIRLVAPDVAMAHGAVVYTLPNGEKTGIQFNDIYVNKTGTWKCISSNNTPIQTKP